MHYDAGEKYSWSLNHGVILTAATTLIKRRDEAIGMTHLLQHLIVFSHRRRGLFVVSVWKCWSIFFVSVWKICSRIIVSSFAWFWIDLL